jgi:phosphoglucosamine mutase
VDVKSKPDISTVPQIKEIIEKVEKELGDDGRVLVRYSGTQNMCRVMVEGPSESVTDKYCKEIADAVKSVLG